MPITWVKVISPSPRDVFVNGNYAEPAGVTNAVFAVETGQNTFTLLSADHRVEASKTVIVAPASRDQPFLVHLPDDPTVPPPPDD